MKTDRIPFLDLAAAHRDLRAELLSVFETALDTSQFVGGGMVQAYLEDDFPFAERAAAQVLSRPMFPELVPEQQRAVAAAVQGHLG